MRLLALPGCWPELFVSQQAEGEPLAYFIDSYVHWHAVADPRVSGHAGHVTLELDSDTVRQALAFVNDPDAGDTSPHLTGVISSEPYLEGELPPDSVGRSVQFVVHFPEGREAGGFGSVDGILII